MLVQLVHSGETTFTRQVMRISDNQEKVDCYIQIRSFKERASDTSAAESGSDINDCNSPAGQTSFSFPRLTPVHEEGRASDSDAYYSCHNSFNSHEASNSDRGGHQDFFLKFQDRVDSSCSDEGSFEGTSANHLLGMTKGKIKMRSFQCSANRFLSLMVWVVSFFRYVYSPFLRRQGDIRLSNVVETNTSITNPPAAVEVVNEDCVLPCIDRLKRLDRLLEEISSKPAGIPKEKEKLLLDSLDRIKSVENDLEKTKIVLQAAVRKQLEIAEHIEKWSQAKCRRRLLCFNA